jgi:hypothetical protein
MWIRKIAVMHAAVANTTVLKTLLDASNTNRDVYVDRRRRKSWFIRGALSDGLKARKQL